MEQKTVPMRQEIDEKFKWKLEDIYPSDTAWREDLEKLKECGQRLAGYKGKIGGSAASLYEYLQYSDELDVLVDSLINYSQRRLDEDTANTKYQAMCDELIAVLVQINSETSFDVPEITAVSDEDMEKYYNELPALELYRTHLYNIRRRKAHILSDAEERILALSGDTAQSAENIYSMFADADLTFENAKDSMGEEHQLTHGTYMRLMTSQDRTLRESAFKSMYGSYGSYKNTVAAILSAQVKQLIFSARARRYPNTLEAALDRTNVPAEVYKNLISAVHDNMEYMYKYVRLRKKLMGLDELHMFDLYAPIVQDADAKVDFEEAKKNVRAALSVMGEEYVSILDKGFNEGWIDVYENKGKRSGAYSAGAKVHPYVLLNYNDRLDSEFTLAHEMGHAIHSYYSNTCQPTVYSDYVIFVAEVASTCNEALLMQYLLKNTDDKRRRAYLINYFLEQFRTTLYRQTMFAEFELKINEAAERGESLNAETLCSMYYDLNKLYFGEDMVIDEEIALEWARIPHFYYNYYVYQYATGYSAAIALSEKILSEGESAVKNYIEFLKGGCSKTPIELLKTAGVDMSSPESVNAALKLFGELIDEMEELLD